ncbi:hypothetical protein WJX84_007322 [Apatococcus fuscideae]|uniref:Zinc-finger domain-containing protein n=1 Tax=Apatococcus fuscideae TaxID=2026836 RepID=A0AAW1TEV6_9CHLO
MPTKRLNAPEAADGGQKKKARTQDPGIRVQGGRIYDSETGTTCHQCRQKTVDAKAKCTCCTLLWCTRCLLNRYGVEVAKVMGLASWPCPKCRSVCNCSSCRKRLGMAATGILAHVSKAAGYTSVGDLLKTNPAATALLKDSQEEQSSQARAEKKPPKPKRLAKAIAEPNDVACHVTGGLIADADLGPRPQPMPELLPLQLPVFSEARATLPEKRRRRGQPAHPAGLQLADLPDECDGAQLLESLEFLQVFGPTTGFAHLNLAVLVAELLVPQHKALTQEPTACSCLDTNQLDRALSGLLDVVSADMQIPCTSKAGWPSKLQACLPFLGVQQAPSCLAFWTPAAEPCSGLQEDAASCGHEENSSQVANVAAKTCRRRIPAPGQEQPQGHVAGNGALDMPPSARIELLHFLCHTALDTSAIRASIAEALEDDEERAKKAKEQGAAARKQARQAWQQQREAAVAAAILRGDGAALSLEDSRKLLEETGRAAIAEADRPGHPADIPITAGGLVRNIPLGTDRNGNRFWQLQGWLTASQGTPQTAARLALDLAVNVRGDKSLPVDLGLTWEKEDYLHLQKWKG